ncbi:hypothetical protein ASD65_06145 [Microbacterium sp. Root61]|uniref:hypothetical protein n=1 Tax=Microbacterium sp. Root61 TaxID=1736570 RepID=UPI0006FE4B90|nr:hypothetical protein [Microbacterium sp. Root61]KRA24050.1 hypothetical protein ASD65_06145 [Microbacterium sp. Root61]
MTPGPLVGAAHGVITPSRPGPLAGYAARGPVLATSTIDDLEATVLVLDRVGLRLAWVTIDCVAVPTALAKRLASVVRDELGAGTRVLVAASHTHSGPAHWLGRFAPGHEAPLDRLAVDELLEHVRVIAAEAFHRRQPSDLSWAEPIVRGLAAPRAVASEAIPIRVGVLAIHAGGVLRAVLVDAPCHPTVLGAESTGWSADWPGGLRRALRAAHPGVEVAFLNGACGDLSTRFTRRDSSAAEADRLGGLVAEAIIESVPNARPLVGALTLHDGRVPLATRRVDAEEASARLNAARKALGAGTDPIDRSLVDGALIELAVARSVVDETIEVPVSIAHIDGICWVATPLEVFSSTAASLGAGRTVRLLGCVDGYLGYLPDAAAVKADTYEARTALFAPEAEPAFRIALERLLTLIHPSLTLETP